MDKISTIYLKELNNIDEIFKENSKLPDFLKNTIQFFKKFFCIITIDKNGFYILPYSELKSFCGIKLFLIKKILTKLNSQIILSKKLDSVEKLKETLIKTNISLIEPKIITNYLVPEIIEYICKMSDQEKEKQNITLLIENRNSNIDKIIIELAKKVKRIQIVTNKIGQFKKIENILEDEYGLACLITNNKRKSLLKSKIIINFDYCEKLLNQYSINPNAIVIDINKKTNIITKAFCGIHVYDYEIKSDNKELPINTFDIKNVYEAKVIEKSYGEIRKILQDENVKVTNLIGKKGIIDRREYIRPFKKLD